MFAWAGAVETYWAFGRDHDRCPMADVIEDLIATQTSHERHGCLHHACQPHLILPASRYLQLIAITIPGADLRLCGKLIKTIDHNGVNVSNAGRILQQNQIAIDLALSRSENDECEDRVA